MRDGAGGGELLTYRSRSRHSSWFLEHFGTYDVLRHFYPPLPSPFLVNRCSAGRPVKRHLLGVLNASPNDTVATTRQMKWFTMVDIVSTYQKQCIFFSTLEHLIYYIFRLPLIASNKPLIDILMIAETSQGFAYNIQYPAEFFGSIEIGKGHSPLFCFLKAKRYFLKSQNWMIGKSWKTHRTPPDLMWTALSLITIAISGN